MLVVTKHIPRQWKFGHYHGMLIEGWITQNI